MDALYENIKRYRHEKGMSQDDLAKLTDYATNAMITRIEKGHIDLSYEKIKKFAEVLGVSVPALLGFSAKDSVEERIDKLRPEWQDYILQQLDYAEYKNEQTIKAKEED